MDEIKGQIKTIDEDDKSNSMEKSLKPDTDNLYELLSSSLPTEIDENIVKAKITLKAYDNKKNNNYSSDNDSNDNASNNESNNNDSNNYSNDNYSNDNDTKNINNATKKEDNLNTHNVDNQENILFEKYKIEKSLSLRGIKRVYLCTDIEQGDLWVIKHLSNQGKDFVGLMVEEDILKNLNHRYIAKIRDIYNIESGLYIVESYIEGTPLNKLLSEQKFLEESIVGLWGKQICEAVNFLHNIKPRPMTYIDIKLSNIIINKSNIAVITDVGIFKDHAGDDKKNLPPEVLNSGYSDSRTDIYTLGRMFYQLLTGEVFYDKKTAFKDSMNKKISLEIKNILLKCLEECVSDRYQNVVELKQDFEDMEIKKALRLEKEKKKKKLSLGAITCLLVIGIIITGVLLKNKTDNISTETIVKNNKNSNKIAKSKQEKQKTANETQAEQEKQKTANETQAEQEKQKAANETQAEQEKQKAAEEAKIEQEKQKAAEEAKAEQEKQKTVEEAKAEQEKQKAEEEAKIEQEKQKAAEEAKIEQEKQKAAEEAKIEQEKQKTAEEAKIEQEKQKVAEEAKAEQEKKKIAEAAKAKQEKKKTTKISGEKKLKTSSAKVLTFLPFQDRTNSILRIYGTVQFPKNNPNTNFKVTFKLYDKSGSIINASVNNCSTSYMQRNNSTQPLKFDMMIVSSYLKNGKGIGDISKVEMKFYNSINGTKECQFDSSKILNIN